MITSAFAPQAAQAGIKTRRRRIGIFGGTFDPIHKGHLLLADTTRQSAQLDSVLFVPCRRPPHKAGEAVADGVCRLEMARLATTGKPHLAVSDIEVRAKAGLSYTIDTLSALADKHGRDTDFYFMMGADSAFTIEHWHRAEELLSRFCFLVVNRPGYESRALHRKIQELNQKYGNRLQTLAMADMDVSSTEIRSLVKEGRSVAHLTPQAVERYIWEHGLYR